LLCCPRSSAGVQLPNRQFHRVAKMVYKTGSSGRFRMGQSSGPYLVRTPQSHKRPGVALFVPSGAILAGTRISQHCADERRLLHRQSIGILIENLLCSRIRADKAGTKKRASQIRPQDFKFLVSDRTTRAKNASYNFRFIVGALYPSRCAQTACRLCLPLRVCGL